MTSPTSKTIVTITAGQTKGASVTRVGFNQNFQLMHTLSRMGILFQRIYWSGAYYAEQGLSFLPQRVERVIDQRASIDDLMMGNPDGFKAEYEQALKDSLPRFHNLDGLNVAHFLENWPTANVLKERLEALMLEAIGAIQPGEAVLISSARLCAELATLAPHGHYLLADAEAMVYIFSEDDQLLTSFPVFNPCHRKEGIDCP